MERWSGRNAAEVGKGFKASSGLSGLSSYLVWIPWWPLDDSNSGPLCSTAANRKEKAAAAFLNVVKAFFRVWHPSLLYKVLHATTPHNIIRILADFFHGRTFQVRVESAFSDSHLALAGVPESSTLSLTLTPSSRIMQRGRSSRTT